MKLSFTLMLLICILAGCKHNKSKEHFFTLPGEWPVEDSIATKLKQRFEAGYVETFEVNNTSFSFQKNGQQKNKYDLKVLQNGQWATNLTLPMPRHSFFVTNDMDLDGYFDLTFLEGANIKMYFFDKAKQQFDSNALTFTGDYALLDSTQLIYGTNDWVNMTWNITILSIRGRSKAYLQKAVMPLVNNTNNGSFEITGARIYKCNNGNVADTVFMGSIAIHKQFGDFSLRQFMKDMVHHPEKVLVNKNK